MADGGVNKIRFCSRKGQTALYSMRCKSQMKRGDRCKNRTRKSPKYWIHLASEDNIHIKPSTIRNAGLGLFAYKKPIPQGKNIGKFTERNTTKEQLDVLYLGTAKYALCEGNTRNSRCINANRSTDTALRYMKDKQRRCNNVRFYMNEGQNYEPYAENDKKNKTRKIIICRLWTKLLVNSSKIFINESTITARRKIPHLLSLKH